MKSTFNVFQYQDYRKLLQDLIADRKKQKKTFSYRWFSQRAGFTSPNILNLVVKGKRHLSSESADKVIEIFGLKKEDARYFKCLVQFQKAKTLSEKEYFARELIRFKKYQNQNPLSSEEMAYYSDWFNIPIRELYSLNEPPQSVANIAERLVPAVSPKEVEGAIKTLLKLGLLKEEGQNLILTQPSVTTGSKFSSYGVVSFHKKMMQLGIEALDRFPAAEREISSVSIGLSPSKFRQVKKLIEEFRDQLMLISEEDIEKNNVYQLNFQLFPLSKVEDK